MPPTEDVIELVSREPAHTVSEASPETPQPPRNSQGSGRSLRRPPSSRTDHDRLFAETDADGCLSFIRQDKGYRPMHRPRLRNSLLAAVGFLELANAGDFAANVWNEVPVPTFARVLMALGGTMALAIVYFAVKDARLSWANVRCLRQERRLLYEERDRFVRARDLQMIKAVDGLLDNNFREQGTEYVDRVGMDILMGFGALLVGVGTFMAIGGDDPRVYLASNLLSGYIGNTPCAAYGFVNLSWSTFTWWRAHRHSVAWSRSARQGRIEHMLKMRKSSVQLHAALNGIGGIVGGAASLITSRLWYAYLVLAPCIVTAAMVNLFWRRRIGYNRPLLSRVVPFSAEYLCEELGRVDSCRRRWERAKSLEADPLAHLLADPTSLREAVYFMTDNQLFEEFCLRILADEQLSGALFSCSDNTVITNPESLAAIDGGAMSDRLLRIARELVVDAAPQCFMDQERFLLETLGCHLCRLEREEQEEFAVHTRKQPHQPTPRKAAFSDVGRHSDAWLFGWLSRSKR